MKGSFWLFLLVLIVGGLAYSQLEKIHRKELITQRTLGHQEGFMLCDSIWTEEHKKRLAIEVANTRTNTTRKWRDTLLPKSLDSLGQRIMKNLTIEKKQFMDSVHSVLNKAINDTVQHFNRITKQLESGFISHFMACKLRLAAGPVYANLSTSFRKEENHVVKAGSQRLDCAIKDPVFSICLYVVSFCLGFLCLKFIVQQYRQRVKTRQLIKSWR